MDLESVWEWYKLLYVVVWWKQDIYGKEAREDLERKIRKDIPGNVKDEQEI